MSSRAPLLLPAAALLPVLAAAPATAGEETPGSPPGLSAEQIPAAVLAHIKTQTAKHGTFWVLDAEADESLALKFVRLGERSGRVAPLTYFAGASFVDPKGAPVEVDVVMRGPTPDDLELLEVTVRVRSGKERYTWRKENGLWVRTPAGAEESAAPAGPEARDALQAIPLMH